MTDLLVQALREDEALATNDEWRVRVCNIAANRIEELEKRVEQAKIVFATMRSEMANVCAVMEEFENE